MSGASPTGFLRPLCQATVLPSQLGVAAGSPGAVVAATTLVVVVFAVVVVYVVVFVVVVVVGR